MKTLKENNPNAIHPDISISRKKSLNLTDVDAVQNYWNHSNHGHFNLELYTKVIEAKNKEKKI